MEAARDLDLREEDEYDVQAVSRDLLKHAGAANGVANGPHYGAGRVGYDVASALIIYEEYNPFGTSAYRAVDSTIQVTAKRYRYAAAERDEETGLDHMGLRYYAPWLGRWTSADPIGLGDGVNRYAYVHGNPVSMRDPSGTQSVWESLQTKAIEGLASAGETIEGGYKAVSGGLRSVREQAKAKTEEVVSDVAGETVGKVAAGYVAFATAPLAVSAKLGEFGGEALGSPLKAPKRLDEGIQTLAEGFDTGDRDLIIQGTKESALAGLEIATTVAGARGVAGRVKKLFGAKGKPPVEGGGAGGGDGGGGGGGDPSRKTVFRAITPEDLTNIEAGKPILARGTGGTSARQVAGPEPTRYISASETAAGTRKYQGPEGVVEIDVEAATRGGSGFVPHKNVLQSIEREGLRSKPRDLANATESAEVHLKDFIPFEAIIRHFRMQ